MASEAEMKPMVNGTCQGDVLPTPELDAQRMLHAGRFRASGNLDDPW